MIIAVGSTNPVKVAAVEETARRMWPDAQIVSLSVPSGVSSMPLSDAETLQGARNRAQTALAATGADLGIGLEGGVERERNRAGDEAAELYLQGWVVVMDRQGRSGVGGAARLPLPRAIAQRVLEGEELGAVMDEVLGETNIKQKGGAVGALTNGLVLRRETFAVAVAYALAPFVAPHLYE